MCEGVCGCVRVCVGVQGEGEGCVWVCKVRGRGV